MSRLYFDYNATTPAEPRVVEGMENVFLNDFYNPSSSYFSAHKLSMSVSQSRNTIADFLNSLLDEIVITSCATESANLALKGICEFKGTGNYNIVTSNTEHSAVLNTCRYLEKKGIKITYLPVTTDGLIDLNDIRNAVNESTLVVSIMWVNNETGVIQPIKEIAAIAHEKGALFMTDATQAAGKIKIDVDDLDVDLLCFSGHKMYAPKGIGALYVRNRGRKVKLAPQMHGGGHEQGLRSGTLNVPGIMALAKACEIAEAEMEEDAKRIGALRDYLETELLKLPNTSVNGSREHRIFNTTNICFKGQDANVMIGRMKDVAVSNGSACSSAVIEPSHVLKAMGLCDEDAFASLRFSLGKYNTIEDINTVIQRIKEVTQT